MKTANENVLRALARVTAMARAGNVEAVAIVAVSPNGLPDVTYGGEEELMPSMNIGLDMMKQQVLFRVMAAVEKPTTSILRPAGTA